MYPHGDAAAVMRDLHRAHARYVWNLAVEQQSWWRPGRGPTPGPAERQHQLAEARAAEPWLARSSSVQQQALRDFDRALAAFFDKENPAGKPRFRSKRGNQGFVIRDTKVRRLNRRWGEISCRSAATSGSGGRGTSRETGYGAGDYGPFGLLARRLPGPATALDRQPTGKLVGIDRGVRTALVTSDGQHYRAPRISDRRAARYLSTPATDGPAAEGLAEAREERAMLTIAAKVTGRRRTGPRRSAPGSSWITT